MAGNFTFNKRNSAADKFEAFFSKILGRKGRPFKNPALFFYLTGVFTMLVFFILCFNFYCIFRAIKRYQLRNLKTKFEQNEVEDQNSGIENPIMNELFDLNKPSKLSKITPSE